MADLADRIKKYREILELDPWSLVFAMLAEELCAAGQWDEAAEVCEKGLVFHPDHLGARTMLGRALMETGRNEEAERILSSVAEAMGKNAIVFRLLSELALASGKTDSAAAYESIYEAFHKSGLIPASALREEAPQRDDWKAEDSEKLDTQGPIEGRKIGLEEILDTLAKGFERRRTTEPAPAAIFSDSDKDMLKQRLVALLGA